MVTQAEIVTVIVRAQPQLFTIAFSPFWAHRPREEGEPRSRYWLLKLDDFDQEQLAKLGMATYDLFGWERRVRQQVPIRGVNMCGSGSGDQWPAWNWYRTD